MGETYLEFIRQRLLLLKELLSDTGSIYLHIDYKIGHYVKIIMDEVFGINNFRNDITRIKCNPKNFARKGYGNIKDLVLFYSKTDNFVWNEPSVAYTEQDMCTLFPKIDSDGRRYTTIPLHAPGETLNGNTAKKFKGLSPPKGRHWRTDVVELERLDNEGLIEWSNTGNPRKKIFLDEKEGKRVQDIWDFKDPAYPSYPTEKNADFLDMVVKTSSNPNALLLDCFCGSGAFLAAATRANRRWIGIDQSNEAIKITQKNLQKFEKTLFQQQASYSFFE